MVRFILRKKERHQHSGLEMETLYTVDCDVQEIEDYLTRGGFGETHFEIHELVGVEVLEESRWE